MKYPIKVNQIGYVRVLNNRATFMDESKEMYLSNYYKQFRRMTFEEFKEQYPIECSFGGGFLRTTHKKHFI